jgi:hypothetical protein
MHEWRAGARRSSMPGPRASGRWIRRRDVFGLVPLAVAGRPAVATAVLRADRRPSFATVVTLLATGLYTIAIQGSESRSATIHRRLRPPARRHPLQPRARGAQQVQTRRPGSDHATMAFINTFATRTRSTSFTSTTPAVPRSVARCASCTSRSRARLYRKRRRDRLRASPAIPINLLHRSRRPLSICD